MTVIRKPPTGIVPDANVLIDYVQGDKNIFKLIVQHWSAIFVPSPILTEVRQLSAQEAGRLGLRVIEPTLGGPGPYL